MERKLNAKLEAEMNRLSAQMDVQILAAVWNLSAEN